MQHLVFPRCIKSDLENIAMGLPHEQTNHMPSEKPYSLVGNGTTRNAVSIQKPIDNCAIVADRQTSILASARRPHPSFFVCAIACVLFLTGYAAYLHYQAERHALPQSLYSTTARARKEAMGDLREERIGIAAVLRHQILIASKVSGSIILDVYPDDGSVGTFAFCVTVESSAWSALTMGERKALVRSWYEALMPLCPSPRDGHIAVLDEKGHPLD